MMAKTSDYSVAVASTALMLFLPSLLMHYAAAAGTVYVVGDSIGWIVPPNTSFYNTTWASSKTFRVNDILTFNFVTGQHDVVRVPKASYDACQDDNEIGETITTGPYNATLTETGMHYFICSIGNHCNRGQHLAINVLAAGALSPSSSPSPSSTTPQAPPPSSAPPRVLAGFFFIMFSFALGKLVL